jgi:regulation of enolase protein 1 (concanavalin A-like superfamily)
MVGEIMKIYRCIPIVFACLFMLPAAAAQRVIGVNFTGGSNATGGNPASLDPSDAAGVVAKGNWNNAASNSGSLNSLVDDSGKATGASITWNGGNTWSLNIAPTSPNNKLMKGYLDTATSSTVSVSRLPDDIVAAGYDVIVYCDGENSASGGGGTRHAEYKIGSTTLNAADTDGEDFSGTFKVTGDDEGGNYIRFTGLKDNQFTLTATAGTNDKGATRRAAINGIQIVSPGTPKGVALNKESAKVPAGVAAWTSRDIGAGAGGSATVALGADGFEIKGAGTDIWMENDGFRYVYQACKGDFEMQVKVVSVEKLDGWSKAGLMVRQSVAPDSVHTTLVSTPDNGTHMQHRPEAGGLSQDATAGDAPFPNSWLKLVRKGDLISCFTSQNGENWRKVGVCEIQFAGTVLVGMCVCSHSEGRPTRAEFRNLTLKTEPGSFAAALIDAAANPNEKNDATAPKATAPNRTTSRAVAEYTPADPKLAAALAASAAKLATDGLEEKAKDMCFKSLANDENCPEALYELGKLLEKSNPVFAAEFLTRASRELGRIEGNAAMGTKKQDADRRLLKLNPYSVRLTALYTDYASDLGMVLKKNTDALTQDEALDRIRSLRLADVVAPDKLPKIAAAGPGPGTATGPKKPTGPGTSSTMSSRPVREGVTDVPVDVEKALKAGGWTKITGTWKKKAEGVYEVTDGKLETAMTNGAIQIAVHKGGAGVVKALVRNAHSAYEGTYYYYGSGYGVRVEGNAAKMFTPYNYSGNIYRPYAERDIPLSEALPKSLTLITIADSNLEITINGKREHRSNYKLNKDGPFVIEIEGTMTIEAPMAKGQ